MLKLVFNLQKVNFHCGNLFFSEVEVALQTKQRKNSAFCLLPFPGRCIGEFKQVFRLILFESLMPHEQLPHKKRKETRSKEKLDVENFQSLPQFCQRILPEGEDGAQTVTQPYPAPVIASLSAALTLFPFSFLFLIYKSPTNQGKYLKWRNRQCRQSMHANSMQNHKKYPRKHSEVMFRIVAARLDSLLMDIRRVQFGAGISKHS